MPRPRLIAIVGGSASGKTQLAHHLAERLGDAVVIPLDAFYRDLSALTPEERSQVDVDRYDVLLSTKEQASLSDGEQAELARLRETHDRLLLRKAHAAALLKWRGRRVPSP